MNLKKPINRKLKLVVLTGAGISAESGIPTFRGHNGLWEGYDIEEVATPNGWAKNYRLVLDFYNARRRKVAEVQANLAHKLLAELEEVCDVLIVTQNIDNLHEQAGSTQVLHLHGEITKACSSLTKGNVVDIGFDDIDDGDKSSDGSQLRPFIVWFGEDVPMISYAAEIVAEADILLIVGTSLEVYPAAGLVHYANRDIPVVVIDPNSPSGKISVSNAVEHLQYKATKGLPIFAEEIRKILC
jgi:NAD-dependent deacetylase